MPRGRPCKYGERDASGKCPPKPKTAKTTKPRSTKTTTRKASAIPDSPVPVKEKINVKVIIYYKNKKILDKMDNTTMHQRDIQILESYLRTKFGSGSPIWIDGDFVIRNVPYDAESKSIRKIIAYRGDEREPVYGQNYPLNKKMLDEKLQEELNEEGEMQNWGKIYIKYNEV